MVSGINIILKWIGSSVSGLVVLAGIICLILAAVFQSMSTIFIILGILFVLLGLIGAILMTAIIRGVFS